MPDPATAASPPAARSTASWPRRMAALALDWLASTLVVVGLIGTGGYVENPSSGWMVLGVFALESTLLVTLSGGSFGQLLVGVRVRRTDGRPLALLPSLARTILVCAVVPPLVFKPDGRGLHDLWTGTTTSLR